jgi:sterol desaturase/sphingolipid hydroxylase (fatty acid hydroxylase superfamily)
MERRRGLLGKAITLGAFPLSFVGAQAVAVSSIDRGWSEGATLAGITAVALFTVALLERIHPEYLDWNRSRGDIKVDAVHGLVSMIILPEALKIGLSAGILVAAAKLSQVVGFEIWPHDWPLIGQLVVAMLISQFGEYWVHRFEHTNELLWRVHATHHSPHRLYFFNAARFHPIDTALSYLISTTVLLVLGAGPEVLLLVMTWISIHGLYQHCNIHLRLGPLNYVFSMAELHRWHHSLVLEEANANYGNNIILWDLVFGTYFNPPDRDATEDVGLSEIPGFPQNYIGQLLSPFTWGRILERQGD